MKRLVFCFDGTWNRLSADTPTNVVLTAASIVREAPGATQIIHYDEGVGTGQLERYSGGVFGVGLLEIVRRAYSFLLFNYDVGDEIFLFGFSRGACSARTFTGLIRHVGILRRLHAARIDEAIDLYRSRLLDTDNSGERMCRFRSEYADNVCVDLDEEAWRRANVKGYQAGQAPMISIKYLGLWDTVCALGVPAIFPFSSRINRRHQFHDLVLSGFVERARHAVAIDERRAVFPPLTWGDLTELNHAKGFASDNPDAPYQEKWFPGGHGSVGGGGDIRGLSDGALAWITQGAKDAGLLLDRDRGSRIHGFHPDARAPLENTSATNRDPTDLIEYDRKGPADFWQISNSAARRWHMPAESLPERRPYRPVPLLGIAARIDAMTTATAWSGGPLLAQHVVVEGDALRKLAQTYYGDPNLADRIFQANRDLLDDPDELFLGWTLRIPRIEDGPATDRSAELGAPQMSDGANFASEASAAEDPSARDRLAKRN